MEYTPARVERKEGMTSKNMKAWGFVILTCVCLGALRAQETVKVCPSCGGTGRMAGGTCVQCRGQVVVRENGDLVNGMPSRVRSGSARDSENSAVFVCQSCGGTGRMHSGGRCVQCKGQAMVRADGSMLNGVRSGARDTVAPDKPHVRVVICPDCGGRGHHGTASSIPCMRCKGRGLVREDGSGF